MIQLPYVGEQVEPRFPRLVGRALCWLRGVGVYVVERWSMKDEVWRGL